MSKMPDGFEEILTNASPAVQELAKRTRALIKEIMPKVVEVPWPKQKYAGYGIGPKKMSEHFCSSASLKVISTLALTTVLNSPILKASLRAQERSFDISKSLNGNSWSIRPYINCLRLLQNTYQD